MRHRMCFIVGAGVLCGLLMAFSFVNPYDETIQLSELILQLSGSRGSFPLGLSLVELISFTIRMIPGYIFELYMGIEVYRNFCTASIFVFSRCKNRVRWYYHEIFSVMRDSFLYNFLYIISVILTTTLRFQVEVANGGITLCLYHIVIYSLWIWSMTMLVNLVAIRLDSGTAFILIVGAQMIFICLLRIIEIVPKLIIANPIAYLVLGWQTNELGILEQTIISPHFAININISLVLMTLFGFVISFIGAVLINRHDMLVSDSEIGG